MLMVDAEKDEILFYDSGGDVSTLSFAQILNALQTANNESLGGMDRICAVIKAQVKVVDVSYPEGSERRVFSPSSMLLGTMGDYDAHCHMLCIVPAGSVCCCIKCNIQGVWYSSVGTRVFAQHRSYLDSHHP